MYESTCWWTCSAHSALASHAHPLRCTKWTIYIRIRTVTVKRNSPLHPHPSPNLLRIMEHDQPLLLMAEFDPNYAQGLVLCMKELSHEMKINL